MENIKKDSDFFRQMSDSNINDEFEDLKGLISDEEFKIIEEFYQDFTQFDKDKSLEVLNILSKYMFKQEEDFAFFTILKFELVEFPEKSYGYDYIFDYVTQIIEGKKVFSSTALTELRVCFKRGYLSTAKFLEYENLIYDFFDKLAEDAGSNGQIKMLEYLLEFHKINPSRVISMFYGIFNHILIEGIVTWNLECLEWLVSNSNIDSSTYEIVFRKAVNYSTSEIVKFIYNTGNIGGDKVMEEIRKIGYDRQLETLKFLMEISELSDDDLNDMYLKNFKNSLTILQYLYGTGRIRYETVKNSFNYPGYCIKQNMEIVKWHYTIVKNFEEIPQTMLDEVFSHAVGSLYYELMEWIYTISEISSEILQRQFIFSCVMENSKFIKFFYETGRITQTTIQNFMETDTSKYVLLERIFCDIGILDPSISNNRKITENEWKNIEHKITTNSEALKIMIKQGKLNMENDHQIEMILSDSIIFGNFENIMHLENFGMLTDVRLKKLILDSEKINNRNFIDFFDHNLNHRVEILKSVFMECLKSNKNNKTNKTDKTNIIAFLRNYKSLPISMKELKTC